MNISSRERNLLIFLLILVMIFVYYQYSYVPAQEQIAILEMQKTEKTTDLIKKTQRLSKARKLQEQYASLSQQMTPLAEKFFPVVDQEEFIALIHHFAEESGLEILAMSFADENKEINLTNMDKKDETEKSETSEKNVKDIPDIDRENPLVDFKTLSDEERIMNLDVLSVNIEFAGNYSQYRDFLSKLDQYQRKIVAKHLELSNEIKEDQGYFSIEKSEKIKGNLTLYFYKVNDLEQYNADSYASLLDNKYNRIK